MIRRLNYCKNLSSPVLAHRCVLAARSPRLLECFVQTQLEKISIADGFSTFIDPIQVRIIHDEDHSLYRE